MLLHGNYGIEVTGVYGNADNIVEAIIVSEPDLVLMDIEMPLVSGISISIRTKSGSLTIIASTMLSAFP